MGDWRSQLQALPNYAAQFPLKPSGLALLIVDMQNSCAHEGRGASTYLRKHYPAVASYFFDRLTELVVPNVSRLLTFFRDYRLRVVHVTVGPHLPDHADFEPLRRDTEVEIRSRAGVENNLYHVGTPEHAIREELTPRSGELVINKTSRGAFNSTGIDQLLRNMSVDSLVIVGVATNACVESTARDAADRGYRCVLVDDACAGQSEYLHDATMLSFATLFGRVLTTEEILEELRQALFGADVHNGRERKSYVVER
jgi:nicotinamidase-related amidase